MFDALPEVVKDSRSLMGHLNTEVDLVPNMEVIILKSDSHSGW